MEIVGIYFSGTGNTRYAVQRFLHSVESGSPCVSIEDPAAPGLLGQHSEVVLGYPVYYSNLPKIMQDFLFAHEKEFAGKQVFLITTMGLFSGDGAGCAARRLRAAGARITGGLHLKMPDCIGDVKALKKSLEENRRMVQEAERKVEEAAQAFKNGRPPQHGLGFFSRAAGLLGQRLWFYGKTKNYVQIGSIDAGKCIGCGVCAAECPMKNIQITQGKAGFLGRCTLCYRCFSLCPRQAVTLLGKRVLTQWRMEPPEDGNP